jgi:hypothetical protein
MHSTHIAWERLQAAAQQQANAQPLANLRTRPMCLPRMHRLMPGREKCWLSNRKNEHRATGIVVGQFLPDDSDSRRGRTSQLSIDPKIMGLKPLPLGSPVI